MQNDRKPIKKLADLEIYVLAVDIAIDVINITKKHRIDYSLKDQLLRAALSIGANIAEGFGRNSTKEFVQFLYIARGSLYESKHFLFLTEKMYSNLANDIQIFLQKLELLGRKINNLIKALKSVK